MWYVWVGSNLAALPTLLITGYLLVGRWLVATDKYNEAKSRASKMLAVRNIVVSLAFLGATVLLILACLWLLSVALGAKHNEVRVYEAYGTLLVFLALVGITVGLYFDLKYTERAAEVAEEEAVK